MVEVGGSNPPGPTIQSKMSFRHKDLHDSETRKPCLCRIVHTETEYASKIDVSTLEAAPEGPQVVNPDLTFAELVDAYCLLAPPY